ncbi:MAG TPA: hypothetical protein VF718_04225 [Allosphingosinicella sp.]|jgi:hypothetical protein
MTKQSGGDTVDRGPAREPGRDEVGEVAGTVRGKGGDPSPDDRGRGETSEADGRAAHERAS